MTPSEIRLENCSKICSKISLDLHWEICSGICSEISFVKLSANPFGNLFANAFISRSVWVEEQLWRRHHNVVIDGFIFKSVWEGVQLLRSHQDVIVDISISKYEQRNLSFKPKASSCSFSPRFCHVFKAQGIRSPSLGFVFVKFSQFKMSLWSSSQEPLCPYSPSLGFGFIEFGHSTA